MARNLDTVLDQMLARVPESEPSFRAGLNSLKTSVSYAAPEMHSEWWRNIAMYLFNNLGEKPAPGWPMEVACIFADRPLVTEEAI